MRQQPYGGLPPPQRIGSIDSGQGKPGHRWVDSMQARSQPRESSGSSPSGSSLSIWAPAAGRWPLAPRQPPRTGHQLLHYGRDAVPAGGDDGHVVAKREALASNGRDAVPGATNPGKSGGAGLGEIAGVTAAVVFQPWSNLSARPVPFRRQPPGEAPS